MSQTDPCGTPFWANLWLVETQNLTLNIVVILNLENLLSSVQEPPLSLEMTICLIDPSG